MKHIHLPLMLGVFILSGCDTPPKTIGWYKEHPKEMKEKYAECKKSGNDTPDCQNAITAHFRYTQENAPVLNFNDLLKEPVSKEKH